MCVCVSVLWLACQSSAKAMDSASTVTSRLFKKVLVTRIEEIIDEDKPIKHSQLADEIEKVIQDPSKVVPKVRLP